jgi:hypothetical protein
VDEKLKSLDEEEGRSLEEFIVSLPRENYNLKFQQKPK